MAKISIPQPVFSGFKIISSLTEDQMTALVKYISTLANDTPFSEAATGLNSSLNIKTGDTLLQTFMSFVNLLDKKDVKEDKLTMDLVDSYIELSSDSLQVKRKNALINNLNIILTNINPIKEILNIRKLHSENENNLNNLNLLTDIRLIFKDNIEDKKRSAIIFHKLRLEYLKEDKFKELYLTLDINDLNELKSEIEKAILKEQILRDDYKEMINFLF